jgi:tetratricopeptide (TPR) repeat protein
MESKKIEFFNRLSFVTLILTLFISLFFFVPFIPVGISVSKGFLVYIGVTLAMFFWLIARLGEGKFTIPRDRLILFAGIVPIVFLISSFFSSSLYISLLGNGFEIGTFGSVLIMFCIFFLSSIYFNTEKRLWIFFLSLFSGALIVLLFQVLNIFIGLNNFAPNFLKGVSSGNLIGSWSDFAIFLGLITALCLFTLEFLKTKRIFVILQYILLVLSLIFLIIINISLVWLLLIIFSVIIFVYSISLQHAGVNVVVNNNENKKKFPFTSLILIFICFIFLVGNNFISGFIYKYVNLLNTDVYPSFSTTIQIGYKALIHNPLVGTGPNTFVLDWSLWQPKEVANTIYWNVDFSNGFSFLTTLITTTGILGFLSLFLLIIIVFIRGIQSLKIALKDKLSNYFIFATLITLVYSWLIVIFYNPNIIMLSLAFASSGILISILIYKKVIAVKHLSFLNDPRNSFFAILGLVVLIIGTLSLTYVYIEKFSSIVYFSKSLNNENTTLDSLNNSEKMLNNALLLDKNDIYYRLLSQVYIKEIGVIVSDKTISPDILKSNIQQLISASEKSAKLAISQNPNNYVNYVNLGDIYSSLISLDVNGSYDNSTIAYNKALSLAPNNPSILLSKASLEFVNKNIPESRKFIKQALDIKVNYVDALFFLSQVELNEGNTNEAIKQAELATSFAPDDATVFFRLGLLYYNNSDYTKAVSAFENAVIIDNSYLNARYFLAQSYQKVGRTNEATSQYDILNKIVPDNQTIKEAMNSVLSVPTSNILNTNTKGKPSENTNTKVKLPLKSN